MLAPNPPRASTTVPQGVRASLGERASDLGIEWDAENRLLAVKEGPNTLVGFAYDASGRRASKTASAVTTTFVYDGAQFLEQRASGGATTRYAYGTGIDQPLAQTASGVVSYFVADHLGSVVRLADAAGVPTLAREYDPWGRLLQTAATSGYTFTGREWDSESGLYYYRARYLDPGLGRFLSEDPAAKRSETMYAYVRNNPIARLDPLGLFALVGFPPAERAKMEAGISRALEALRKSCPCLGCDSRAVAEAIERVTWIYEPRLSVPIIGPSRMWDGHLE